MATEGQRVAVDGVDPVRVDVVREPRGAADAGDEDDPLARDAQLRQERLDGGQDHVVTAAGAPPDFLVGLEVLHGQLQLAVAPDSAGLRPARRPRGAYGGRSPLYVSHS